VLRRDNWYEFTDDGYVLAISKWTDDREALATALKETGWFFSVGAAIRAAETVVLTHTWSGVDSEGVLILCDEDGAGGTLVAVAAITIADVEELID